MLGLPGIGLGPVSGVALRLTAAAGTAMMAFMWMAEWPLAQHASTGAPSMSSNPLVDYHVMFAAIMIALAVSAAGTAFSLGGRWARLPLRQPQPLAPLNTPTAPREAVARATASRAVERSAHPGGHRAASSALCREPM